MRVFRPLVRMLLRHGIPYKTIAEWLRWVYVQVANEEFRIPGRKQSKSRVAVLTGLTRVDVDRLLKMPSPVETGSHREYQRAAKVLTGWARDETYLDDHGQPCRVPFQGPAPSFEALVERFSGGTPPRAVLDELIRVKAVEKTDDGMIQLLNPQYVPIGLEDARDYFDILGQAAGGLVTTIAHNTDPDCDETWLQGATFNDRIPADKAEEIAAHIKNRGRELIFEIDDYLYQQSIEYDQEQSDSPLMEAGLGIYFFRGDDHGEEDQ
ncbi:MAG: DUF6502 family protein [Xanthomonadales bacterium]|nr:DUF6502 family protein [Xanthomonadales bacterium]